MEYKAGVAVLSCGDQCKQQDSLLPVLEIGVHMKQGIFMKVRQPFLMWNSWLCSVRLEISQEMPGHPGASSNPWGTCPMVELSTPNNLPIPFSISLIVRWADDRLFPGTTWGQGPWKLNWGLGEKGRVHARVLPSSSIPQPEWLLFRIVHRISLEDNLEKRQD